MLSGSAAPIRILVVDDEQSVLDAFRFVFEPLLDNAGAAVLDGLRMRLLGSGGNPALLAKQPRRQQTFHATYCSAAADAVAALRNAIATNAPFNIVFLDSRLPTGRDSLLAAQRIRELDQKIEIVICADGSDANPLEFGRSAPAGGQDLLPVETDESARSPAHCPRPG